MLDTEVRSYLLTTASEPNSVALAALVGDRVRPTIAKQGDAQPLITYKRQANDQDTFVEGGASDFSTVEIEFTIESKTYMECGEIASLIESLLNGKGFNTESYRIAPARLTDETTIDELVEAGTDKPFFSCAATYSFHYRSL